MKENPSKTTPERAARSVDVLALDIVRELYDPQLTETGSLVLVPRAGSQVAMLASSDRLVGQVQLMAFQQHGRVCKESHVVTALQIVRALAEQQERQRVWLRVAKVKGRIYHDLGQRRDRFVRLSADGWRVVRSTKGARFYRSSLTAPLPTPVRGGSLDLLRPFVNATHQQWPLLWATLVCNLDPTVAQPIRVWDGSFGSGKTWSARRVNDLIDPIHVGDWDAPSSERDWYAAAPQAWVIPLDNVSNLDRKFANLLCKASTGGGSVVRELFQTRSANALSLQRAVSLTTTGLGGLPTDLASRIAWFETKPFARRAESVLLDEWGVAHPLILGALYDLACKVMATLPDIEVEDPPRLVEFARRLAAVDQILGTQGLGYYQASTARLAEETLQGHPLTAALVNYVRRKGAVHETAAELLQSITPPGGAAAFRITARALTECLKNNQEHLRRVGILWTTSRDTSTSRRRVQHLTDQRRQERSS